MYGGGAIFVAAGSRNINAGVDISPTPHVNRDVAEVAGGKHPVSERLDLVSQVPLVGVSLMTMQRESNVGAVAREANGFRRWLWRRERTASRYPA